MLAGDAAGPGRGGAGQAGGVAAHPTPAGPAGAPAPARPARWTPAQPPLPGAGSQPIPIPVIREWPHSLYKLQTD